MIEATGSAAHVAALRRLASARARSTPPALDGIGRGRAVYRALGLPFLPPEVRDGTDADRCRRSARRRSLRRPRHRSGSPPGAAARAPHDRSATGSIRSEEGWRARPSREAPGFLTVTDHPRARATPCGLTVERLPQQWMRIAVIEERLRAQDPPGGTESDIPADGRLDYLTTSPRSSMSSHREHPPPPPSRRVIASDLAASSLRCAVSVLQDLGPRARDG